MQLQCDLISGTVNPLYNDIRYNSKFVITSSWSAQKIGGSLFFIDSPMLFFRKTYVVDTC